MEAQQKHICLRFIELPEFTVLCFQIRSVLTMKNGTSVDRLVLRPAPHTGNTISPLMILHAVAVAVQAAFVKLGWFETVKDTVSTRINAQIMQNVCFRFFHLQFEF